MEEWQAFEHTEEFIKKEFEKHPSATIKLTYNVLDEEKKVVHTEIWEYKLISGEIKRKSVLN